MAVDAIVDGYAAMATIVVPAIIGATVARDPTDDAVLATALAVDADLIVSGDAHLLDLKSFHRIPIVAPAEALRRIPAAPRTPRKADREIQTQNPPAATARHIKTPK